jgi:GNAT superfamily N-acetyltransferase
MQITKTSSQDIADLRKLFLHENNFQFIYDKCHYYGWADAWLFTDKEIKIGYGAVWGTDKREDRDSIFEFYLLPPWRKFSSIIFQQLIAETNATLIECQSNDILLTSMLYEFANGIRAEAILFKDHIQTNLHIAGTHFGKKSGEENKGANIDGFFVEFQNEVVATGGFLLNYNFPYADIYMDVNENYRQKGFGSLIVQELKKEIYKMGRVPAARCNTSNYPSKSTLIKAGFIPCGFRLKGVIKSPVN